MMDDNSAILDLITEFLVSKNLLTTAHTLQREWVELYPGHNFPDIKNHLAAIQNASLTIQKTYVQNQNPHPFPTAIPVEPPSAASAYFHPFQQHDGSARLESELGEEGELTGSTFATMDETMNEEGEGEEGEGEEDGEGEEAEVTAEGEKEEGGEGAEADESDAASADSAYSRILVEDIAEIMDEIAGTEDEEDMGEIDPLANEAGPSDETESEAEEDAEFDNNEAGEEDAEFENNEAGEEDAEFEEEGEGEEGEGEPGEGEDEGEEEEEEEEGEGEEGEESKLAHKHLPSRSPSPPSRGPKSVIESVTELLGQHIQIQRDEFYQEEEASSSNGSLKGSACIDEISTLTINDHPPQQQQEPQPTNHNENNQNETHPNDGTNAVATPTATLTTTTEPTTNTTNENDQNNLEKSPSKELFINVDGKITPTLLENKHLNTSVTTPPVARARSALYKRENSFSPMGGGKKHVQISTDTDNALGRSSSSLGIYHVPTPVSPHTPPKNVGILPPPQPAQQEEQAAEGEAYRRMSVGEEGRMSVEGGEKGGADVVMKDISTPTESERPPDFTYPVSADGVTYDCFNLKIVHIKNRTGFESTKDFPIKPNTLVAGRYQILEFLDSAAFSKAIRSLDLHTGREVCMKIIKNNKDYVDQSLDEIKLLKYLNSMGDPHKYNILQLYDFFYFKEHLFIVTELLRDNLYEFYKYTQEQGHPPYFTIPRLQRIARQCLSALEFIHGLDIIHTDLKPENILIKSYSRCEVKIIDFGSSCFTRDHLGSYVQSRDYRAIEVILGLPYSAKIDIWSLGCILAELFTGKVLFVNRSLATLLARVSALIGQIPLDMIAKGRFSHKFFTKHHNLLYERDEKTGQYFFLQPKRIQLKDWLKSDDPDFVDFVQTLLALRPDDRPTATAALQHKWIHKVYPSVD